MNDITRNGLKRLFLPVIDVALLSAQLIDIGVA